MKNVKILLIIFLFTVMSTTVFAADVASITDVDCDDGDSDSVILTAKDKSMNFVLPDGTKIEM